MGKGESYTEQHINQGLKEIDTAASIASMARTQLKSFLMIAAIA